MAIQASGVSKRYEIGERRQYGVLRDIVSDTFRTGTQKLMSLVRGEQRVFARKKAADSTLWALENVNFEIEEGQAIGIIGKNGAGKSTLLKILSRVTEPTTGLIKIRGRLGSLLEVGTGFHPELTGRENIYLSGIILGMKRHEINRRFDEIVAFAEVEKFIDTPVRHYSSGMYVRLAFSVAAHMDVEVLLVDEVLAVGDASFQKRCLGKMDEAISSQGRTVLFVSHNLGAIRHLTDKCILLNHGKLLEYGDTEDVVNRYLHESMDMETGGSVDLTAKEWRRGTGKNPLLQITFTQLNLINSAGQTTNVFFEKEEINVEITFQSTIKANALELIVVIMSFDGTVLFSAFKQDNGEGIDVGTYKTRCRFYPNLLRAGNFRVRLYMKSGHWQDVIAEAITFQVESSPTGIHELNYSINHPGILGVINSDYQWGNIESV